MLKTKVFYLLLVVLACWHCQSGEPAWEVSQEFSKEYFFLDSLILARNTWLVNYLDPAEDLWPPSLSEYESPMDSNWRFAPGDPAYGLIVGYEQRPMLDSIVHLPHRVMLPNYPLWYERTMILKEDTYLYANGDDGVQCFLDGRRLTPQLGNFFLLQGKADSLTITLRVLNNALSGGLRKAAFVKMESFLEYLTARRLWGCKQQLLFMALRSDRSLSPAEREAVVEVLRADNPGRCQALIDELGDSMLLPDVKSLPRPTIQSAEFSFSAWGDSQGGWPVFNKLARKMAGYPDAFSIGLGDLVANGSDPVQWNAFIQCLQPLLRKMPVVTIAGNHDYDGYYNDLHAELYHQFTGRRMNQDTYFSWQNGGVYFIALDPNRTFPIGVFGDQLEWFFREINSAAWDRATWRFILIHQPPYAQGWPGYHGDVFIRSLVDSLAESHHIDFVLSGHSHDYERLTRVYGSQSTHFVVLGGAGGGLEPPESSAFPEMDTVIKRHHFARFKVDENAVRMYIYDPDNRLLDSLTVR